MSENNFPLPVNSSEICGISDHLLLNRYRLSRTPEMFLELVRRHTNLVYGTCLRITENSHDAEELTQECFWDLSRQANQIRTSLVGWLHQTATHRALNRRRSDRRRQVHEHQAEQVRVADQSPAEPSWTEIAPLVDQALSELPEEFQAPVLLHYLEGATQAEIASSLGVHQSTVSRRLSEGVQRLRDTLRKSGFVIPTTLLVTSLISQSAMAAPPAVSGSLGKIALAGIGTSISANVASANQMVSLFGVLKGAMAFLAVPIVAGILWGDVVFLLVLVAWCSYLGWYRPEWYRVLCYTRQFPDIYEWPFFPLKRWTWQSPPKEWGIWMTAFLLTGMELLGLVAIASLFERVPLNKLWLTVAGVWQIFMGLRILFRVRRCRTQFPDQQTGLEFPVDGVLLLTYALAGVVLFAKLCVSPTLHLHWWAGDGEFWLSILCVVFFATVLMWGAVLVLRRYRQWRLQGPVDPIQSRQIDAQAPPHWLLCTLAFLPLALAIQITFFLLVGDVFPIYVPYGEDVIAIARRRVFSTTLFAMDLIVLTILPLGYLYRRIPRIIWGVGFAVLGLTTVVNIGYFTSNLVAAPVIAATPIYASSPRMQLQPGRFIVESHDSSMERKPENSDSHYWGKNRLFQLRFTPPVTIILECSNHAVRLDVVKNETKPFMETSSGSVMILPSDFEKGVPTNMKVSLVLVDMIHRKGLTEQFLLPLSDRISPANWNSQYDPSAQVGEKDYPLGETVYFGTIQGKPVTLSVVPSSTEVEEQR